MYFFEGPEKKVEICISNNLESLRNKPIDFWNELVAKAKAKILSSVKNQKVDAYLLSESSLFVFDHKIILITCGTTTLSDAIIFFLEHFSKDQITNLIFERKNEHFPEYQSSNFLEDFKKLNQIIPGEALRFGSKDSHHINLFNYHQTNNKTPSSNDQTFEVLMHGVPKSISRIFSQDSNIETIRKHLDLTDVLPGYKIDDYLFTPNGYSLNAIKDEYYYTFHITPEDPVSYISFETNFPFNGNIQKTTEKIIDIFKPRTFDLFYFSPVNENFKINFIGFPAIKKIQHYISSGYQVNFQHHLGFNNEVEQAESINIQT